jgi:hypothetical protein
VTEVILQTNHGVFELEPEPGETLGDLLARHRVPMTAVWTYVLEDHSDEAGAQSARRVQFVPASDPIPDDDTTIFVRAMRNINIPGLIGLGTTALREVPHPATEWLFPDPQIGAYGRVLAQLTAADCADFVMRSVEETVAQWPTDLPRRLVLGVSGGGDSNILLSALVAVLGAEAIVPAMMLGIPDWDTQLPNAQELCRSYDLELQVIDEPLAARYAGVKSIPGMRDTFRHHYPDADMEFLGTWLLRKVLGAHAAAEGIEVVGIGSNREDVLAEGLACLARGRPPLPIPFRTIGETTFVYPMWKVPKKIGDGAYPMYSLENYEARDPSHSSGRSVYYYAAYMLAESVPGLDLTLTDGLAEIGRAQRDSAFEFFDDLGEHALAGTTVEQREKWQAFLAEAAP